MNRKRRREEKIFFSIYDIDFYVAIILSIVIAILALIQEITLNVVIAVTLVVLGLVTQQLLRERIARRRLQNAVNRLTQPSLSNVLLPWTKHVDSFKEDIVKTKQLSMLAVSPRKFIQDFGEEILNIENREDGQVRLLLVDPDGTAINLIGEGRPENKVDAAICMEHYIPRIALKRFEMRKCNYIPAFIITILEQGKDTGIIYVTAYSFQQADPKRPSFRITSNDPVYKFFKDEFEALWNRNSPKGNK
jgi:hypothetical protein